MSTYHAFASALLFTTRLQPLLVVGTRLLRHSANLSRIASQHGDIMLATKHDAETSAIFSCGPLTKKLTRVRFSLIFS